jgi:hypothetical protein
VSSKPSRCDAERFENGIGRGWKRSSLIRQPPEMLKGAVKRFHVRREVLSERHARLRLRLRW